MISVLDEVLRQLLIRELPVRNGEVDIVFDQPKREWSARINRPTLNLFLHDIRENNRLRQTQPAWEVERNENGTATRRRRPVRVDLHYFITAWANEPEDEHRLLTRALLALFRTPEIPEELLPETLGDQPVPIPIMVALDEEVRAPADIWSALDNEMRPVVTCIVTLSLNPYEPATGPLVSARELRFGQTERPAVRPELIDSERADVYWSVGGMLQTEAAVEDLQVKLVEQDLIVPILADKRFAISRLRAGDYTLEVSLKGGKPRRHKITVPAADYELAV